MGSLRIAEMASRTGVPATTLRYYEEIGLVIPAARQGNGYRAYSERDVERVRFLTRAKQLDLRLDDLRELLEAWDADDCAGVQDRMVEVVSTRLATTQERIVGLTQLAEQLQTAAARLSSSPPKQDGGCDAGCVCLAAASPEPASPEPASPEPASPEPGPPEPEPLGRDEERVMTTSRQALAGAAAVVGCGAACSAPALLPTVLAGGATLGLGAVLTGATLVTPAVAFALIGVMLLWRRRGATRVTASSERAPQQETACRCGGTCGQ